MGMERWWNGTDSWWNGTDSCWNGTARGTEVLGEKHCIVWG